MPTYEYECTKCGKVFELFQSITEPPRKRLKKGDPRPCPCDAAVSRRISTGGGLIFKGSGFYLTDYRSESYKQAAKKDGAAGESGGDGAATKGGESEGEVKSGAESKSSSTSESPPKKRPIRKTAEKD